MNRTESPTPPSSKKSSYGERSRKKTCEKTYGKVERCVIATTKGDNSERTYENNVEGVANGSNREELDEVGEARRSTKSDLHSCGQIVSQQPKSPDSKRQKKIKDHQTRRARPPKGRADGRSKKQPGEETGPLGRKTQRTVGGRCHLGQPSAGQIKTKVATSFRENGVMKEE